MNRRGSTQRNVVPKFLCSLFNLVERSESMASELRYFMWKDKADEWRWYLKAANEKKIAESGGDGYKNKKDCEHAIDLVKGSKDAPVYTLPEK